jgi:hypothetical protein
MQIGYGSSIIENLIIRFRCISPHLVTTISSTRMTIGEIVYTIEHLHIQGELRSC